MTELMQKLIEFIISLFLCFQFCILILKNTHQTHEVKYIFLSSIILFSVNYFFLNLKFFSINPGLIIILIIIILFFLFIIKNDHYFS
jgi:hypothetical protein